MRKVLSAFLVASVLLLCAAPIFCMAATAPFTFDSSVSAVPTLNNDQWGFIAATSATDGIYVIVESEAIQNYYSGRGIVFTSPPNISTFGLYFRTSSSGTVTVNISYYSLSRGWLLTTHTEYVTLGNQNYPYFSLGGNSMPNWDDYLPSSPVYYYPIGSSVCATVNNGSYEQVDPFVNWGVISIGPGGGGSVTPDPVDPTDVIRSRIPRPFGNAVTMYIADHLYLYAIYVGVPQQFEQFGYNQTNDPTKYQGDNYNIYDVSFVSSGSALQLTIKNRAQFSYNVIISQYDIVDGSYVTSVIRAITVASDPDTPSVNIMTISLSDPSTYGIYQSGFFARSQIVGFPELRISWSDTIDYSLDFFVIRQGIVSIVEGIATTNNSLSTANSTLTTISSTSASILTQLQAFYTLADDNWYWFKNTFYIVMSNKWNITNQYLLAIHKLLIETDETMTIEDDTSGVASMESAKNDLVITNAGGQPVDAADAAAAGLSDAASQIGEIAQPVSTINTLMQTIVFDKPKLLLPVIVALGLGLMVTILGKNKSD